MRAIALERRFDGVDQYLAETMAMSSRFRSVYRELDAGTQLRVRRRIARDVRPFARADGSLALPGSSLVASASA